MFLCQQMIQGTKAQHDTDTTCHTIVAASCCASFLSYVNSKFGCRAFAVIVCLLFQNLEVSDMGQPTGNMCIFLGFPSVSRYYFLSAQKQKTIFFYEGKKTFACVTYVIVVKVKNERVMANVCLHVYPLAKRKNAFFKLMFVVTNVAEAGNRCYQQNAKHM